MGANTFFKNIKNMWFLASNPMETNPSAKRPNSLLAPVQFYRLKQDTGEWRSAITEAENPILPYRVKMQRIYADTRLNGHVYACMNKRKSMVFKKGFALYKGNNVNDQATELITKPYVYDILNYVMDAQAHGYSLISFGDMIGDEITNISIVKRENISPDRLNVSPIVYSPQGIINFMDPSNKDKEGISFYDWTAWIPTQTETAQSNCGYGYLYNVALYEIYLRNILAANADFIEVFGQPLKHAKSSKLEGDEYDKLEQSLANMASNPYLITDHETEVEFINANGSGEGYKSYDNFEERLEKKISKIILGHADAMDSTPGKLGSNDSVEQALRDTETSDLRFVEYCMNKIVIPKLIKIGIKIPVGHVFKFKNDHEIAEQKEKQTALNKDIASYVSDFKKAGYTVDETQISELTGLTLTKEEIKEPQPSFTKKVQNKLNELYGGL